MRRKIPYKVKLFLYFFVVFISFTSVITGFQYNREKQFKIRELESLLNSYTDFANSYFQHKAIFEENNEHWLDSLIKILPRKDIRLTVIDFEGTVLYDSYYHDFKNMENHKKRPEIQSAFNLGSGSNIRFSESTNYDYYYYAKKYETYFVRAAIEYNITVKEFLQAETLFFFVILLLFLLMSGILLYVSGKIGKSIMALKDFAIRAANNEKIENHIEFPENELGIIGEQIISIYNNLNKTNQALKNEKDKLIHHLQISQEGVAIFSNENEKILANNHFIQYLSLIADYPVSNPSKFSDIEDFIGIKGFIKKNQCQSIIIDPKNPPIERLIIEKNKRYFDVQCVIFIDKSYEISIIDVTKAEKNKLMKQQMTSNIAHELRTPVSSIKGYLETVLESKDLPEEKKKYFIEKANNQTERLSELIRDISMLTKIEEAAGLYEIEEVEILAIVKDVIENLHSKIEDAGVDIAYKINADTKIKGNKVLLYSIFQNLLENSINYAGNDISICIDEYHQDDKNVYFSFSDNGSGISEEHQSRIFERFYRIDHGRARKTGGTGLGLAIVKNAVQFHKGDISVKTKKGGGAEFLFNLNKG
ncbi:MAG: GHKL domain-containing protein [Bacteroidetes bacterium]|nr:GHKL domain-containing protein [Bacteroidota bacterium]